jgi:hypothetical protein
MELASTLAYYNIATINGFKKVFKQIKNFVSITDISYVRDSTLVGSGPCPQILE